MQRRLLLLTLAIILSSVLMACEPAEESVPRPEPTVGYELGEIILETSFENAAGFNTFAIGDVQMSAVDGEFQTIVPAGGYIWTLNNQNHQNVVMELTTEVLTPNEANSIHGVMCRAHPLDNGVGYYFLLRGDGYFGIRRGTGDNLLPMVNWTAHPAIRTERNDVNTLRIVCVEDYLALYINDQFAAETRYDWLQEGYTGFALNGAETDTDNVFAVAYDDLTIWEATLADTEE